MADDVLMLGVSGLRGTIGGSLTPEVAARFGAAVGTWFVQQAESGSKEQLCSPPCLVVGRDSRLSGQIMHHAVVAGLMATGCEVVELDIVSTPAVGVMASAMQVSGGIVITASHNPAKWNGIKVLLGEGRAPAAEQMQQIAALYHNGPLSYQSVDRLGKVEADVSSAETHCKKVLEQVDASAIRAANLTAVVDSVHGAGGTEAQLLLEALGVKRIAMFAEPTGAFPHEPEPIEQNLHQLCEQVRQTGADIGLAQDPDADRLAMVDETGRFIGEEYTLSLGALHKLSQGNSVAANLSTSRMVDDVAAQVGGRVIRTPVGEANVAQAMIQHDADLGGEGNGGIIWRPVSFIRDSLIGMAFILEMMALRKQKLSVLVDQIPRYAMVKQKAQITPELKNKLSEKIQAAFSEQTLNTSDGVRVDWADRWVHVRPSNTEPIIRLIAEAATARQAQDLIDQAKQALELS